MEERIRILEAMVETRESKIRTLGMELQKSRLATRDKFVIAILPALLTGNPGLEFDSVIRMACDLGNYSMQIREEV